MVDQRTQAISFQIIASVGEAKALAIEAIRSAKIFNFNDAEQKIKQAEELVVNGEKHHFELIAKEANGEQLQFALLLVHAEDQMLSCQTIITLAIEFIELYKLLK